MSIFNANNIHFVTQGKYTLVVVSVDITSKPHHSITIKSQISSTTHVILNKNTLDNFCDYMSKSPITNNSIYVYNEMGNIISHYKANRNNNLTNVINISTEPESLLGNISFPNVNESDNIFFPLTSYTGLDSVVSDNYRSELLYKDIEIFRTNNNLSNVTLVIGKTLHSTIKNILSDNYEHFPLLFKSVIITEDSHVIKYIVELLCGKVISGHSSSFNGFLNFGSNYEVINSTICHIESNTKNSGQIFLTNRPSGRIQVYFKGECGIANFIIILYKIDNSGGLPFFIEEITNTTINVTNDMSIDNSTFPGLSINYIKNYLDTIKFQKELQSTSNINQNAFIQENTTLVIHYLFSNTQTDVEDITILNNKSRTIYNLYKHLINEIRLTLEQTMYKSYIFSPRNDLKLVRQFGFKDFFQSPSINQKPYIERTESSINL